MRTGAADATNTGGNEKSEVDNPDRNTNSGTIQATDGEIYRTSQDI